MEDATSRPSMHEISLATNSGDVGTKPPSYYAKYEQRFREVGFVPRTILELGVHKGESTRLFATVYPEALIVGIDIVLHDDVDFSAFPNVRYVQCDQADPEGLAAIVAEHFPDGVDLVIDDASHIGWLSQLSFEAIFPLVRAGGIYIVEDCGTGYVPGFPDGGRFGVLPIDRASPPKRLRSFDYGMVGFVKSLVDLNCNPLDEAGNLMKPPRTIDRLEFWGGVVFAHKV